MPDYISSSDGNCDAWQENFMTYATANAAALGLEYRGSTLFVDHLSRDGLVREDQPDFIEPYSNL